jgi:hypothetical protein
MFRTLCVPLCVPLCFALCATLGSAIHITLTRARFEHLIPNGTRPAITSSIREFAQIFGTQYNVTQSTNHTELIALAQLVRDEYGDALDGIVDKIIIFGHSPIVSGLYRDKVIAVSSEHLTTFHHELMHGIARSILDPNDIELWVGINGYESYLGNQYKYTKTKYGYVSKYAMASLEEDLAETFLELMTMEKRKAGFVYDAGVMKKFDTLVLFLGNHAKLSQIVGHKMAVLRQFDYRGYIRAHTTRDTPTTVTSKYIVRVSGSTNNRTLALYCASRLRDTNGVAIALPYRCEWVVFDIWGVDRDGTVSRYIGIVIGMKTYEVWGADMTRCFDRGHVADIVVDGLVV